MQIPETSTKLHKIGAAFRKKVLAEFDFEKTHDFRRLDLACSCLDRIETCRQKIEEEGLFVTNRFQEQKENPAAKAEREQKIIFIRILRELNLDFHEVPDTRPPRR